MNNIDLWQGSSVGESARLIPARSRVRISPLLVFLRVIAERSCFTTRSTLFFKLRFYGARGSLSFERQSVFLSRHCPRGRVGVNDGACSNYTNSEVKRKTNLSLARLLRLPVLSVSALRRQRRAGQHYDCTVVNFIHEAIFDCTGA